MSAIASPTVDSPRPMSDAQLDQLSINCIRTLSIDAVQQAKSGHPGTPMALAPLIYTLWNRVMCFDPQASTFGWERYVSPKSGRIIGMNTFGASAPLKELQQKFGFEPYSVTEAAKTLLGRSRKHEHRSRISADVARF
jgi:transketolase